MSITSTLELPAPTPVDAATTYVDRLLATLETAGERPVLIHATGRVAGADLRRSIFRFARALHVLGIGRGDLVAVWAPNEPAALAIRYATHVVGAASMFLPDGSCGRERTALLADVDPQLLVVFAPTARLVPPDLAIPIATVGTSVPGALRLDVLAEVQDDGPIPIIARPDDLAVVVSSGGSTGVPKGSCRSFVRYGAMVEVPSPRDRRQLVNGELAHLSQVLVDQTLLGGGVVALADSCAPAPTLAAIEDHAITDVFLVEPQLADLVDDPTILRHDLSSLRNVLHIGASAPATLRRRARRILGPIVTHTYGASEVGIVSRIAPGDLDIGAAERFTCAGRPLPGVEVRFRAMDGVLAPDGGPGVIEVRSPAVATGYRNRPAADPVTFLDDGWVRTGDLGCLDPDGELCVLGRAADVAAVDGRLVTPTAVEDTLMTAPEVRLASVVVDAAHRRWVAAVVPWPGVTIDVDECLHAIRRRHGTEVAAWVVIVPVDHLPLTGQGKPDRARIAQLPGERRCRQRMERSSAPPTTSRRGRRAARAASGSRASRRRWRGGTRQPSR